MPLRNRFRFDPVAGTGTEGLDAEAAPRGAPKADSGVNFPAPPADVREGTRAEWRKPATFGWIIYENNGNSFHADNYEQRPGVITATARYRSVTGAEGNKIVRYGEPTGYVWPAATVKIRGVN